MIRGLRVVRPPTNLTNRVTGYGFSDASSNLKRSFATKVVSPTPIQATPTPPPIQTTSTTSPIEPTTVPSPHTPPPPPPPPPKRKSSFFRRLFRLTALASVAGLGYFAYSLYDEVVLPDQAPADVTKPRLLVIGSGWGSVAVLKSIDMSQYNVTVISPRNYFLFTPLLPSTATGLIEHRSLMEPTRAILRKKKVAARFVEGEVTKVDPYAKKVAVSIKSNSHKQVQPGLPELVSEFEYDKLVLGVGATTNYFGIKGVKEFGCFLKEIEDTQKIRRRIMDCMEAASAPGLPKEERRRLMQAVVVGAGATGVEFAGELHDFVYHDLRKYSPEIVKDFKVSLIEGTSQILGNGFNKQLVSYAIDTLEREQIDIMTDTLVKDADAENVYATKTLPNGKKENIKIPYGLFVWAGGIDTREVVRELFKVIPEQSASRRGLKVDEYLRVIGAPDIWAIGDCADAGLAATAQVASQEGVYVGNLLNRIGQIETLKDQRAQCSDTEELKKVDRHIRRASDLPQFKYSHQGSLAYIGSEKALVNYELAGQNFASGGTISYIFWRSAYLSMVFSMRNKLLVALDWTKVMIFGRDISRE